MERRMMNEILKWYQSGDDRILFLYGAPQVGKTWLVKEFCERHVDEYIYLSLKDKEQLNLSEIEAKRAELFIIDGVDEYSLPLARRIIMKMRCEETLPEYRIILVRAIVSEGFSRDDIGDEWHIRFMKLCPMDFEEFCLAIDLNHGGDVYDAFKTYLLVGGMPECVQYFLDIEDCSSVRRKQTDILYQLCKDIADRKSSGYAKIRKIIEAIGRQACRDSADFSFRQINENARVREYGETLMRLQHNGIVYRLRRYNDIGNRENAFKLYIMDVGLFGALCQLHNGFEEPEEDALVNTFLIQEFYACGMDEHYELCYWHKPRARAKLPLILRKKHSGEVVVLDVEGVKKHLKSIYSFRQDHEANMIYRLGTRVNKDNSYEFESDNSQNLSYIREEYIYNPRKAYDDIKEYMENHATDNDA